MASVAILATLSHREMAVDSVIYDQIPTIWWKFGENRSSLQQGIA